ncbi:hypothetical protein MNBD_GAMMA09-3039 [hydrothermal vent metagenome]|uniref:DUF2069 domain-containing protein n=1 Tax=hydrothermal vent metagenome TaxID=652676 RepID=A0A3B0YEH2_9ZZZZ
MDKILVTRITSLLGYFGLLLYIPLWHLFIEPKAAEFISITLLVQVGPLMFPLRGLLHGKVYTHAWAMYLALFYFVLGIWYAGDISTRNFGIGFSLLSIVFFMGTMLYTRFQGIAENKKHESHAEPE